MDTTERVRQAMIERTEHPERPASSRRVRGRSASSRPARRLRVHSHGVPAGGVSHLPYRCAPEAGVGGCAAGRGNRGHTPCLSCSYRRGAVHRQAPRWRARREPGPVHLAGQRQRRLPSAGGAVTGAGGDAARTRLPPARWRQDGKCRLPGLWTGRRRPAHRPHRGGRVTAARAGATAQRRHRS